MGGASMMGGAMANDAGLPDMMPAPEDMGVEQCTPEGELMEEFPCCEGTSPVECREFARNECIPCNELPRCLPCGDGVCGPGENLCNCDSDCDFEVECYEAGQQVPNVPDAPGCCGDLVAIGCDRAGPGGLCEPCEGSTTCSPCGNGVCDPAENNCNCPVDCQPVQRCVNTLECLQNEAAIDCGGVWRCDPDGLFNASDRSADGCSYTCFEDLSACVGDQDCFPGEVCRDCPPDACNGRVCMDPDSL